MTTFGSNSRCSGARKAAQQRRTPKRKRVLCGGNDGDVLECGSVLPLLS
jgi:hypothetical protein